MPIRDQYLLQAIEVINAGSSLDVVGDHGSGRSRLLRRIGEYFEGRGLRVVTVSGSAAFSTTSLAALGWLGVSTTNIQAAFKDLLSLMNDRQSLILVDNWDDVDDISWGLLSRARHVQGTPIVATRLTGFGRERGFSTTGFVRTYQLRLRPFLSSELERALVENTGHEIEAATMARIYAKTGGNIGLALALYEAAQREGRLRIENDVVSATGELWTSSLSTIIESLLRPLNPQQRAGLETLAVLGPSPLHTAIDATARDIVEVLSEREFIDVFPTGTGNVVTLRQSLVTDYFRHEPNNVRRLLTAEDLKIQLGSEAVPTPLATGGAAVFVTLVHEHEGRRLAMARNAWQNMPSRHSAVELLNALNRSGDTGGEIPGLLRKSEGLDADNEDLLAWELWRATYDAIALGDAEKAVHHLRDLAARTPLLAHRFELRATTLETMLITPSDASRLSDPRDLHVEDAWRVQRARAFIALVRGDIETVLDIIPMLRQERTESEIDAIAVIAYIADGQYGRAREISYAGLERAQTDFDAGGLYRYAYLGGLSALFGGRWGEGEDIIRRVVELAAPRDEALAHLGVMAIAAAINARRTGGPIAAPKEPSTATVRGPFPGMQREWVDAERLRARGENTAAARLLTTLADELWAGGYRLAAAFAYLVGAEADLGKEHLLSLETRVSLVGGEGIEAQRKLVIARITRDVDAMTKGVQFYENVGRWAPALVVWREIADLARASGDNARADAADQRASRILADFGDEGIAAVGDRMPRNLTDREREVARLVASGLSNTEIAEMLFVSTRTVESHLNRVLKKAAIETRAELRELFRGQR